MRTESDTPFLATPADLLASRLRQIAMRMQFRIEAITERGGETVGLSLGFAGEIERACREAAEWVAPPVPLPSNKYAVALIHAALASARREALEEAAKWLETHAYASFSEAPHHRVVPWPDEPPDVVRRTLVAGLRALIEKD